MYRKINPSISFFPTKIRLTNFVRITKPSHGISNTKRFASNNIVNYPGHIPTSTISKVLMGVGSAVHALSNPHRGDMIAVLGETTGAMALQKMYNRMANDETGRLILKEKPIINETTINLKYLRTLPETTFGGAYAKWMGDREFTPNERSPVHFVDDPELAYVMRRYREAHDFWHVLSGTGTTVVAEIGVKWFELLQTGLPLCAISSFFGPLRLSWSDLYYLNTQLIPWALRSSGKCKDLMNVYYEHHFEKDLDQFRKELNFEPFVEKQQ